MNTTSALLAPAVRTPRRRPRCEMSDNRENLTEQGGTDIFIIVSLWLPHTLHDEHSTVLSCLSWLSIAPFRCCCVPLGAESTSLQRSTSIYKRDTSGASSGYYSKR